MKNYLLLILIPLIFAVYSFALKNAEGPNYNYGQADPSYVYLINSLTMSNFEGSGHTDHPGTPLQIAGAVILKTYFAFTHEKDNITEDVIYRPETYLRVFDHTIIILNVIGLFLAGLVVLLIFKNVLPAMIFQCIPFVSINILEVFSLIKTENFAFVFIVLQIALILKYVYDTHSSEKKYYLYISGILCGLILATKISFLCILFLPLIIFPDFKKKIVFILIVSLTFVISVLPVISNMEYFLNWVSSLLIHSGRYGKGGSTFIDISEFFRNILKISFNEKFFIFTYLMILITTVFIILRRNKIKELISPKESKFCMAIFFAMSVHILMVAKHYSSRYMFPALLLSVPALFVSADIFYKMYFKKFGIKYLYVGMLGFLLLFGFYNGRKQLAKSRNLQSECLKVTEFLSTNYPGASVILSVGITSESASLIFAYFYSPEDSRVELKKYIVQRFPELVWYDVFNEKLIPFTDKIESIRQSSAGRPILYRTTDELYNAGFVKSYDNLFNSGNTKLTEVFSNEKGELIYRLDK